MYEYEISVIVPTYNSSKTLEETIFSILSQDFKNFEIVFIDDASSDDTVNTILYLLDGKNVNYQLIVNKINMGPAYSRNRGLKASKGHYIVFLDSDDIIKFNHFSSLYKYMCLEGINSVFTKGIKIDEKGVLLDFQVDKFDSLLIFAREREGIVKATDLIEFELLMKIPFSFVLLIYDKEIIKNNGIQFNENYRYGEDTDFALKYLANCKNVRVIDIYTYFYYQKENSISRKVSLERFDSVKLFEELDDIFSSKDKDLSDKLIHSRVPRFIFGNMNYFFYEGYDKEEIFNKMNDLDLFEKLKLFKIFEKRDWKFFLKIKLFLLNPNLYYKLWKLFKNQI